MHTSTVRGLAFTHVRDEVREREPGVDEILDEDDVAPFDLDREVLEDAHPPGVGRVARDRQEVDDNGNALVRARAREIRQEEQRALQHADEHDAVGVVGADLGGEPRRPVRRDRRGRGGFAGGAGRGRRHSVSDSRDGPVQEHAAQCTTLSGQVGEVRLEAGVRDRVPLAEKGQEHLCEQRGLPLGEVLVHLDVARLDAVAEEPGRRPRRRQCLQVVDRAHPLALDRHDEPVRLELVEPAVVESGLARERRAVETRAVVGSC